MKKAIAIILGAAALAACSKTSTEYAPATEIAISPVTSVNKTRAGAVSGTDFPDEIMVVNGFWNSVNTGTSAANFLNGSTLTMSGVQFKKNGSTWAGWDGSAHLAYLWPSTGSMLFSAYSPVLTSTATYTLTDDNSTVKDQYVFADYEQSNETDKTIDLLWSPVTGNSYDKTSASGGVPMTFSHALSWITFKAVSNNTASTFCITNITLKNVAVKGTGTTSGSSINWVLDSSTPSKDIVVYTNTDYNTTLSNASTVLENNSHGTVVIPQSISASTVAEVSFRQTFTGTGSTIDQTKSVTLNTLYSGSNLIDTWVHGRHYTYELVFGESDEILINPSLNNWTEVPVDQISIN